MLNKDLFSHRREAPLPLTDTVNAAGARAYALSSKQALAQYAATGCLSDTFYASAEAQLDQVLTLACAAPSRFVAQTALWARGRGHMKDMPAVLVAYLTVVDPALAERVFDRVIDDVKMLRNFVQVVRSGALARRSLASMPKRLVQRWLDRRPAAALFRGSVGAEPSLADVIKLAHPRPADPEKRALYGYLLGRAHDAAALPDLVQAFEAYKARPRGAPPAVPFQMLTALELGREEWETIALNASWTEARMNLNTYLRHGALRSKAVVSGLSRKLRDREVIARSRVLPYQLLMAHKALDPAVPAELKDALEEALEIALENVPTIDGKVFLCPDVSGSMSQPVTGYRGGATSAVRCVDVAALVAAAMLRVNDAAVLPFDTRVVNVSLSRRDSVMTNAAKLGGVGGGGTSCSAPLAKLNAEGARGSLVVLISDNESWVDERRGESALMVEWAAFRRRNPRAKLVCLDLVPNRSTQASSGGSVLNVGGFSDAVFQVVADFAAERGSDHWVRAIEAVEVA